MPVGGAQHHVQVRNPRPSLESHQPEGAALALLLLTGGVRGTEHWTGRPGTWLLVLSLPLTGCGTLIQSRNLSEPQAAPCSVIQTLFRDRMRSHMEKQSTNAKNYHLLPPWEDEATERLSSDSFLTPSLFFFLPKMLFKVPIVQSEYPWGMDRTSRLPPW